MNTWEEYVKVHDAKIAGIKGELIFHDGSAAFRTYDQDIGHDTTAAVYRGIRYHVHVTIVQNEAGDWAPKWKYPNSYHGAHNAEIWMYRHDDRMRAVTNSAKEWAFSTLIPAMITEVKSREDKQIEAKLRESRIQIAQSTVKIAELKSMIEGHQIGIVNNKARIAQLEVELGILQYEKDYSHAE